jgi:hypothetical protein
MIYWVMGGTAVGKKHLIKRIVDDPDAYMVDSGVRSVWFEDGEYPVSDIVRDHEESPLIIRWQWGRENAIRELAEIGEQQMILACKVMPSVQVARVIEREGELKWPERTLIRESEDVQYLIEQLSIELKIMVRFMDTTT